MKPTIISFRLLIRVCTMLAILMFFFFSAFSAPPPSINPFAVPPPQIPQIHHIPAILSVPPPVAFQVCENFEFIAFQSEGEELAGAVIRFYEGVLLKLTMN